MKRVYNTRILQHPRPAGIWSSINVSSLRQFGGLAASALLVLTLAVSAKVFAGTVAPGDVVVENLEIADSLTGVAGDPAEGRKIFLNKKLGNCLACHANKDMADQQFHGGIGPALDGAGTRWKVGQLRTIVVNAKKVFSSETVMPGFYSLEVGADVRKDLIGKTILSAQQIEDVVAYLATLK